ncbi:MAG: type II secretion system F family protein, partial [Myxococcota bacterium]
MPVFAYKGVTTAGRSTRGLVDAESLRAARSRLRRDGVFLTELAEGGADDAVREKRERRRGLSFRRVSALDLALLTRQLSTLVGAGIPLVTALSALTEQVEGSKLKAVVAGVRDRVNEGATLADALAQAGPFSELYVGMVRAGETGGALEQVLARLAEYLESQVRLRNKVGSVLIYPVVMFGFAMLVVAALVTVVLPQITQLLASLDQELPVYTRAIIALSDFARSWWWALGLGGAALFVLLRAAIATESGRRSWDRLRLDLPVAGRVVRLLAISRFSRTLSTLLAGGIPIVRALDVSKHVANNVILGEAIDAARVSLTEGATLAAPLRASGEFPALVVHMVDVGERSGELESLRSSRITSSPAAINILYSSSAFSSPPFSETICTWKGATEIGHTRP